MSSDKELAYRYDLFIAPDWRERFDRLIDEKIKLPERGRILDANGGTGSHAVDVAQRMQGRGEVAGVDSSLPRVELARAKAQVKKLDNIILNQASATNLSFEDGYFDLGVADASFLPRREIPPVLAEMVRVAGPGGLVELAFTARGASWGVFS